MAEIPQWALERAAALCCALSDLPTFPFEIAESTMGRALALYIVKHERPPVDPLREEAIALVLAEAVTRTDNQVAAIKSGQAGQEKVALVMTALRRGMELASPASDATASVQSPGCVDAAPGRKG